MNIDVRQQRWGHASVNTGFAVKLHDQVVEMHSKHPGIAMINGKDVKIENGQIYQLKNGGKIHRLHHSRIFIISKAGGYVDAKFFVGYINLIVKIPETLINSSEGLCKGEIKHSTGLFHDTFVDHKKFI